METLLGKVVSAIVLKKDLEVSHNEATELKNWFDLNYSEKMHSEYFIAIQDLVEKRSGIQLRLASKDEISNKFSFHVKGTSIYCMYGEDCIVIGPYINAVEMANK